MDVLELWSGFVKPIAFGPLAVFVGGRCAGEILDFTYENYECHKKLLSRGLGMAILMGSAFIKIPQIIKIVLSRSTDGLSAQTYLIELMFLILYASFNYRNGSPPISYGETALIMAQNVTILMLILRGHSSALMIKLCLVIEGVFLAALCSPQFTSFETLSKLQPLAVLTALISKLPQFIANRRRKNTGQLSAITVTAQAGGAIARALTSYIDTANLGLVLCNIINLLLSSAILVQIFLYRNKKFPMNQVSSSKSRTKRPKYKKSKISKHSRRPSDSRIASFHASSIREHKKNRTSGKKNK